jgi:signal transduction histidine kinase
MAGDAGQQPGACGAGAHAGQQCRIAAGSAGRQAAGRFEFHKHLAADSQPFDVAATQTVGWAALPWGRMALWALVLAAVLACARHGLRQRAERSRAEELLRLGQVARLNTLGELAAGMAHELNQPLTAVMASTQAARRLLDDDPPELDTARQRHGAGG